ncbi:MAG TPA: phage holin family protein [Acidobacteriaceae bacterium]|jgi:putative membrane protein|nr:phage holin family protein [Acidobacteriaceae bacterium]
MIHLLIDWLLSALALMIVAYIVPGFIVENFRMALIAALVVGLLNATVGFALKILTFPLTFLTLGLFLVVINALILWLASALVPGFKIKNFLAAILGAIVLTVVHILFTYVGAMAH